MVTHTAVGLSDPGLQAKVIDLERGVEVLTAAMRLLLALVRVMDSRLERRRLPRGEDKAAILRAVERTSKTISLRSSLQIVGLSSSRYYAWKRAEPRCLLDDADLPSVAADAADGGRDGNDEGDGDLARFPTRAHDDACPARPEDG